MGTFTGGGEASQKLTQVDNLPSANLLFVKLHRSIFAEVICTLCIAQVTEGILQLLVENI